MFNNLGAYQLFCKINSTRAQYYEALLELCGMIDDPDNPKSGVHRECEKSQMTRMENAVQAVITAVRSGFKRDPFDPENGLDKQRLYLIHSGRPVPEEAQVDVLRADALGAELKEAFVENRLKLREIDFFDPINRTKLLTMEHGNKKVRITSSQGKVIQVIRTLIMIKSTIKIY